MSKLRPMSLNALRVFSNLASRLMGGLPFLGTHSGQRDLNAVFGWPTTIDLVEIQYMYNRGGIARRVAHAYPNAVWGRMPQVYDSGVGLGQQAAWDIAWNNLVKKYKLRKLLWNADVLASLGRYGIIVIGSGSGNLNTKARVGAPINFIQAYSEVAVKVKEWDRDPNSATFGQPLVYTINPATDKAFMLVQGATVEPSKQQFDVHYSRVVHIAHQALENDVYGVPIYSAIWDYLIDLRKVIGASSESYWLNAYGGMQIDVDKDLDLSEEDEAALETEVDEYVHGMRRFMRTRGVKVNPLEATTADPTGAFNVLITLISGTTGIPKRILVGSEAGQLASEQDKGNWAERVEEYRNLHAVPNVLVPLIDRLTSLGALPEPLGAIEQVWPDAYRMSPLERGQTAAQTARTLANIAKAMESPAAKDLVSKQEARAIVGLSTDNLVLSKDPEI